MEVELFCSYAILLSYLFCDLKKKSLQFHLRAIFNEEGIKGRYSRTYRLA